MLARRNLEMDDRPGSYSRVRTSEDKVCRKDWCWSVRTVYVLESIQMQKRLVLVCENSLCPRKQPDVTGPGLGEAGRYRMVSEPTLAVSRARTGVSAEA